jgi:hypothetical protein
MNIQSSSSLSRQENQEPIGFYVCSRLDYYDFFPNAFLAWENRLVSDVFLQLKSK